MTTFAIRPFRRLVSLLRGASFAALTGWVALSGSLLLGQEAPPARENVVTPASGLVIDQLSNGAGAISPARIREHITYLASPQLAGRGPEGKAAARQYIIENFQQSGLQPLFAGEWTQHVPGRIHTETHDEPDGANVGGFIPGTDPELRKEWIIINAHYDHLGIRKNKLYPGADDNASGVAMLLEVSRQLAARPLRRSVAFVGFDFEETLLWGSRWFVANPPMDLGNIKFSLTADMIGRSLGGLDLPLVFVLGAEHSSELRAAIDSTDVPDGLEISQLGTDMIGTRSDYGPFRAQEIPYLFFSTGEHPDYHSPRDVPERIDYEKTARINEFILDLVRSLGDSDEVPRWSPAEYQKMEEAKTINRVAELVLQEADEGRLPLSSVNRFFVTQVKSKTAFMLRRDHVSDEERPWLVRSAQLLLRSVF